MSITPQELQKLLDELEAFQTLASARLGKPARDPLDLKDTAGMDLSPPARKTIDLEGRLVKDGVRRAVASSERAH